MRNAASTLEREAQLIEAYLDLQRVRMGRRLDYGVDIAPALRHIEVPPMMLLTLVENAIKHGLAPLREGGRVDVRVRLDGRALLLEVADTGRGFGGETSGGGTGLANIRARLAAMFGSAARFTLAAGHPRGIVASIHMPLALP
jgi:LytS/YehU family sensor histidine kinase